MFRSCPARTTVSRTFWCGFSASAFFSKPLFALAKFWNSSIKNSVGSKNFVDFSGCQKFRLDCLYWNVLYINRQKVKNKLIFFSKKKLIFLGSPILRSINFSEDISRTECRKINHKVVICTAICIRYLVNPTSSENSLSGCCLFSTAISEKSCAKSWAHFLPGRHRRLFV